MKKTDFKVKLKNKEWKLKVTLGFWKSCGYTHAEAEVITKDSEKCLLSLRLAVFYGNREEYGWENLEDMKKVLSDADFEAIDEDCTEKLSLAMVEFLPPKMKALVQRKIAEANTKAEELINNMLNPESDQEKKSQ
jgi:hypothetical protein